MKIALVLLAFAGLAAGDSSQGQGQHGWKQGQEYIYSTKLQVLTGVPQLKNQFAGFQTKLQLLVQVKDKHTLAVKAKNVRLGEINSVIPEGGLSQDIDFKPSQDAKEAHHLERPILVNIDKGTVKSLIVDGSSPPEVINVQKALINALQIDLQGRRAIDDEDSKTARILEKLIGSSRSRQNKDNDERTIFSTMEDSINGKCETLYDISAIPASAVKEDEEELIPSPKACSPGSKVFEVVATTNFSNCDERPVLNFVSPVGLKAPPGVARTGDFWNRAAETVYILCGKDREQYVIQRVIAKDVIAVSPFQYDTEDLQGIANLNLTLKHVGHISEQIHAPQNPIKIKDLTFQYPSQKGGRHGGSDDSDRRQDDDNDDDDDDYNDYNDDDSEDNDDYSDKSGRNGKSGRGGKGKSSSDKDSDENDNDNDDDNDDNDDDSDESASGSSGRNPKHGAHKSQHGKSSSRRQKRSHHSGKSGHHSGNRQRKYQDSDEDQSSENDRRNPFGTLTSSQKRRLRPSHWQVNATGPIPKPSLTKSWYLPLMRYGLRGADQIDQRQIAQQIVEEVKKVAALLNEVPEDLHKQKIPLRIEGISRSISYLDLDQLKNLWHQVAAGADANSKSGGSRKDQIQRNILLDAISMAGTNPAIMLIKDLILSQKIKGEPAIQAVQVIPKYARTPTKELVDEVFDLVTKIDSRSKGKGISQLESSAILAFATLVNHVHMRPQTQHTKYPTSIIGALGSPKAPQIANKWVPYIASRLRSADSNYEQVVFITALGHLGHESILPVLRSFVDGHATTSVDARTKAIFALRHLALRDSIYRRHQPAVSREVMKALATIFTSPGEQYEVRIVALANLILTDPPFVFWQKIALRSWIESDNQVSAAIHSTLASLADSNDPEHYHMSKKAAQALKLAKPVSLGLPYSLNYMSGDTVEGWNLHFSHQITTIGSRNGLVPNKIYWRLYNQFGGFDYNPLEISLNTSALQQVASEILEDDDDDSARRFPALNQIRRALNIRQRENGPAEGSMYVKILGEISRIWPIDDSLEHLIKKNLPEILGNLRQGQDINAQKAIRLTNIILSVPTQTGIPIVFSHRYPLVASIIGKAKLNAHGSSPIPDQVSAKIQVKALLVSNKLSSISVVEPLSKNIFSAGVEKRVTIKLPISSQAIIDLGAMKVEVATELHPDKQQEKDIELLHHQVHPFTAIRRKWSIKPVTDGDEVKSIHVTKQAQKKEASIGKRVLGINLKIKQEQECCLGDFASWVRKAQKFSPLAAVLYFDESNTIAARQTRVILDNDQSETQQVIASIHIGTAEKGAQSEKVNVTFEQPQQTMMDDPHDDKQDAQRAASRMANDLKQAKSGYAVTLNAKLQLLNEPSSQSSSSGSSSSSSRRSGGSGSGSGSNSAKREYSTSITWTKGTFGLKEIAKIQLEREAVPGYDPNPWKLCAEGEAKFPDLPNYSYKQTVASDVRANAWARISFGQKCQQDQPQIKVNVDMKRSDAQTHQAKTSEEAEQCIEDNKQGQQLSASCKNATLQASTLDQYDITINYERIPDELKAAAYGAEDLIIAQGYPYLQTNRLHVQNKPNEIKIKARVEQTDQDDDDLLDVLIKKPSADIRLTGVPLDPIVEVAFPLNARQSLLSRASDLVLAGGNDQNECKLEGQNIVTYDNASYELELSEQNYHLLTKDCSNEYKFAVLAKQASQGGRDQKKVKILLGNTEIKIDPTGSQQQPQVIVNGQPKNIQNDKATEIKEKQQIVALIASSSDGYISIEAVQEQIQVVTDGKRIVIQASPLVHQENLCGLCGNFDGEQSGDLQTPEECIENPEDADDFVDAYEVEESGSSSGSGSSYRKGGKGGNDADDQSSSQESDEDNQGGQSGKKHGSGHKGRKSGSGSSSSNSAVRGCVKEEDVTVAEAGGVLSGAYFRADDQKQSSGSHHSGASCTQARHKVMARSGEKCFSIKQVPECKPGCSPTHMVAKKIAYHCLPEGSLADHLVSKAEASQQLPEMSGKAVDVTRKVFIPKSCSSFL